MFFKCKKLLTDIVDKHKQSRTHQHGYVLDDGLAKVHALQGITRQRECQAVGYQVTHDDVQRELDNASQVVALIVEGEVLVQEILVSLKAGTIQHIIKSQKLSRCDNQWWLPKTILVE